jgi:hypothetical protein
MAETVAKVINDIVAEIGRARRDGGISSALVNEKIVMDGYPAAARTRNETIIVRSFGMSLCGGFLDRTPLDRNTGGVRVDVDGLILCPGAGNMVEYGIVNDRKLNSVKL